MFADAVGCALLGMTTGIGLPLSYTRANPPLMAGSSFGFDSTPIAPTPLASLPPLPTGERLEISAPGLGIGLGGRLWPSASLLCRWLRDADIDGQHVLELGAGCGAVGLYAAALGAESVLLTDGGGDALLEACEANIERNQRFVGKRATVRAHRWGERGDLLLPPRVDLVLGADVTYARNAHEDLLRSIRWLCDERAPRVVLAHEHRLLTPAAQRQLGYPERETPSGAKEASELTLGGVAADDVALQNLCELAAAQGLRVSTIRQVETAARAADDEQPTGQQAPRSSAISLLEVAPV